MIERNLLNRHVYRLLPVNGWEYVAGWSAWVPFAEAAAYAPLTSGVYVMRMGHAGPVVYVGMAGERNGRGLRGRLGVYASGKAAVSGCGEAALNRALADLDWLRDRLAEVEADRPRTASNGSRCNRSLDLYVCWATAADRTEAIGLERYVLAELDLTTLWNVRPR